MKPTVLLYLLLCAETNAREIDVTCKPHTVWFEDGKTLNVNIEIKNIPNGQPLFQNVFLFGSTEKKGVIDNVRVGDYIGNKYTFDIKQYVYGSWDNKTARVCLMSEQNKTCDLLDQDFIILKHLKHAKNVQGNSPDPDCTMGSCLLTYDWTREHCENRNRPSTQDVHNNINMNHSEESSVELPREKRKKRSTDTESEIHRNVINNEEFYKKVESFNRSYYDQRYYDNYHNLRVEYIEPGHKNGDNINTNPVQTLGDDKEKRSTEMGTPHETNFARREESFNKEYNGNNGPKDKPEIGVECDPKKWKHCNISCSSRMNQFDLLYLYVYQEHTRGSPLLLHMGQYLGDINSKMMLSFNKTLQDSDKHSKVLCVRESIDNLTRIEKEKNLLYTEEKMFDPFEPSVINVSPPVARFAPGETLIFVCSGTPTYEGRELTWYIQDSNTSAIELPDSDSQKYDPKTNQNILTLHMNETLLTKKLFCAEDFHIQIKYPESNFILKRYGIRNESAVILKLRAEEVKVPVQPLIWGLAGGGAVLLLVIFFIIRARSRRRGAPADGGHEGNEEEYYSTAQVKYVVLDLPQSQSGKPEQRADPSPYAKIVGVYNPGK